MKMLKHVDSLLQEMQQAALCLYLSDLHSPDAPFDAKAISLILHIPDDKYSLAEWNAALSYVTNTTCSFSSVQEAKARIKSYA